MMQEFSDEEFCGNISAARKAALDGPVFITEHGVRTHVLLNASEFDRITRRDSLVGDLLTASDEFYYELDIPPRTYAERNIDL